MQSCSSLTLRWILAARRASVGCIMCDRPHSRRMGPDYKLFVARLLVLALHARLPACARASRVLVCGVCVPPGGCALLYVVWLRICAQPLRESYPLGSCLIASFRLTASTSCLISYAACLPTLSPDLSNPAEPSTDPHGRYQEFSAAAVWFLRGRVQSLCPSCHHAQLRRARTRD